MNNFEKILETKYPKTLLFDYHERPSTLKRLTPPWINAKVLKEPRCIQNGEKAMLKIKKYGFSFLWEAEHTKYHKNHFFQDNLIKGPFKEWMHKHYFITHEKNSFLRDCIEYKLYAERFFGIIAKPLVKKELNRMFNYRHAVTANDIQLFQKYPLPKSRILISGTGGIIGSELAFLLKMQGHEVYSLVREKTGNLNEIVYDYKNDYLSMPIENFDYIIHLAGEPIGSGRWNDKKKQHIIQSRVGSTAFLVKKIKQLKNPPKAFFCASAIGYYGNSGKVLVDESSDCGNDFISGVCKMWENEAMALENVCRVVLGRFGVVLTLKGGALKKYNTLFNKFLGFTIADGNRYISWISLDDALYSIFHCLYSNNIKGAVNITSDFPCTQKEFAYTLSKILKKPVTVKLPDRLIFLFFGQKGKELLLSSCRVSPGTLNFTGFSFIHSHLEKAIRHLLGRTA